VITRTNGSPDEPIWLRKRGGDGCEVKFSACGSYLVDGSWDGDLAVLDIRTGEVVHAEAITHSMITALAHDCTRTRFAYVVSPKATTFDQPSAPDYVVVREWPFSKSNSPLVLTDGMAEIHAIAFSPDATHLVMVGSDNGDRNSRLQVRSLTTGAFVTEAGFQHWASSQSTSWHTGGDLIANVERGGVRVYDASLGRAITFLPCEYACHAEFSPCGSYLGVGAWSKGFVCTVEEALAFGVEDG
jgi:WD40 repeat protein